MVGCAGQRTPDHYTGAVEKNFRKACEAQGRSDNVTGAKNVCKCAYDKIKADIKFSRFKKINSDMTEKPGPLPSDMAKIVAGCTKSG